MYEAQLKFPEGWVIREVWIYSGTTYCVVFENMDEQSSHSRIYEQV